LFQNLFYIVTTTSNIILRIPTFGGNVSLTYQTFNAAFCLLGLPFIFAGLWGVACRLESHLRLYLGYQFFNFAVDMLSIAWFFVAQDTCEVLPLMLRQHGSAFACGFMRIFSLVFVFLVTTVELYFIFTIWSLCEDFRAGGGGSGLPQLLQASREAHTKKRYYAPHGQEDLFGPPLTEGANFPVAYGAFASPGLGGSTRIFRGDFHETSYPTSSKFV